MRETSSKTVHISIVSHGHGEDVARLLADLQRHGRGTQLSVILTINRDERLEFNAGGFSFPLMIHRNDNPQGFAENNNQAFRLAAPAPDDFFCLINPDVRIPNDVLTRLVTCLENEPTAGVIAPLACNRLGQIEDSARPLPSPMGILGKALGIREARPVYASEGCPSVDWVAGLFMLFPARVYGAVGGFNERYFLYYEDVDLCCRLRLAGYQVLLAPDVSILHDARRDSHWRLDYFLIHLRSMARFFSSATYRRCRRLMRSE